MRSKGTLSVDDDDARFVPRNGPPVMIRHVDRVSKGLQAIHIQILASIVRRLDTYIEVVYGDPASPQFAYLNDGRWFGWATCLPHRKLLGALNSLAKTS